MKAHSDQVGHAALRLYLRTSSSLACKMQGLRAQFLQSERLRHWQLSTTGLEIGGVKACSEAWGDVSVRATLAQPREG